MPHDIDKKIHSLYKNAKTLQKLRVVTNEIMSNYVYNEKNLEQQRKQIEKLQLSDKQKDVVNTAWELKKKCQKNCSLI